LQPVGWTRGLEATHMPCSIPPTPGLRGCLRPLETSLGERGIDRYYAEIMSGRSAQLREAYHALGCGDLDPWMRLLDPGVIWRATDRPDVPETPT
jgi:hypothetical protein